jgi:alpha-glucosidase
MRFWFAKGVAGFRLDAMLIYLEDADFRDNPLHTGQSTGDGGAKNPMTNNLPADNEIFQEMRKVTDEYPGRVLIGEDYLQNIDQLAALYGNQQCGNSA